MKRVLIHASVSGLLILIVGVVSALIAGSIVAGLIAGCVMLFLMMLHAIKTGIFSPYSKES